MHSRGRQREFDGPSSLPWQRLKAPAVVMLIAIDRWRARYVFCLSSIGLITAILIKITMTTVIRSI